MNNVGKGLIDASANAASTTDVTIAQLSDTHLGLAAAPNATYNLRVAVKMINALQPDAVILSGDIGETPDDRAEAQTILQGLTAPVYYVPGNHDVYDTNSLAIYQEQFGPDYYSFWVKNVEVLMLDSELLGNYTNYNAKTVLPLPPGMAAKTQNMLIWLANQASSITGQVVIAVQHIPLFTDSDNDFPPGNLPYWTVNPPYAESESNLLITLGVKDMLAGHWHNGRVFEQGGITIHAAPAISYPIGVGGKVGFSLHTITAAGDVSTEFVPLPDPTYFDLVWHLNQTNFPFYDSTLQYPATKGSDGIPMAGVTGMGLGFNGSTTYLDAGALNLSNSFTLSAWINISPSVSNVQTIWASKPGSGTANGFAMNVNDLNTTDGALDFITGNGSSSAAATSPAGAVTFGQWHLVTAAVDTAANVAYVYVDGNEVGSGSILNNFSKTNHVLLGMSSDGAFPFNGAIDEARVEFGVCSSNWIWSSWANAVSIGSLSTYARVSIASGNGLNFNIIDGGIILNWPRGTLQSADQVTGPYTDVSGAVSPYTVSFTGAAQLFFRVKIQ